MYDVSEPDVVVCYVIENDEIVFLTFRDLVDR